MSVEGTHNYVTIDGAVHHNSGKTTAQIMKIAYEAQKMAACTDGVRRSRCVIVRNTRQIILDSTLKDFLKWFPDEDAGDFSRTELKFLLKFNDVECEVLMRGLDTVDDTRRLLSTQFSFGIIEEFRELNPALYEALAGRVGRYPDKMMVPPRPEWGADAKGNPIGGCVDDAGVAMKKIWGASNPPELDSWWETVLSDPPQNMHVTLQPSGMSQEADWIQYLDTNYYENLMELHAGNPEWIDVNIHAQFGRSLSGKPVFRSFNREMHVAKSPLIFNPLSSNGLIVGMDCALHPSAVICQMDPRGRLLVLHSLHAADTGALRFVREHLKPVLVNRFGGAKVRVITDPAGNVRSQTDEKSVTDIVRAEGLTVQPAKTNSIAARIAAVDHFLTRMVDGQPGMLIDAENNRELVMALAGKYRYRIKKTGEAEDLPDKSRPWSDLVDGLQYACLHADGGNIFGEVRLSARREIKPPAMSAKGWT